MRLTPPEPDIKPDEGFTDANDLFGYREFAQRLTNLVKNIDEPLVISLDGPWGTGKTVFVKQWAGLLRQSGVHVIQFDAFGNDHFEDGFLAISAEIHSYAEENLGDEPTLQQYVHKAKKVGTALLPLAARLAIRVATSGLLSGDGVQGHGDALKSAVKESADEVEGLILERITKAKEEHEALKGFREKLTDLSRKLVANDGSESNYPLIFIIDELDRCRPPFALSIIERVEHLFSVRGVCFVFVTNFSQLERAVQGAYGATIDARTYLEKFYNLRVELPESTVPVEHQDSYIDYLWEKLEIPPPTSDNDCQKTLRSLAKYHALSLRQLERVMTSLALAIASKESSNLFLSQLVTGLCVMRLKKPALYEKARSGTITWQETYEFLRPDGDGSYQDDRDEMELGWWRYSTDGEMQGDYKNLSDRLVENHNLEKSNLMPFMADYIESLKLTVR